MLLIPFGFNLAGKSLYLYVDFGSKDLILGSSIGVSHNALAASYDGSESLGSYGYDYGGDIYSLGPVEFLIEPGAALQLFRFDVMTEADYLGFEFPWLILPGLLFALAFRSHFRPKAKP